MPLGNTIEFSAYDAVNAYDADSILPIIVVASNVSTYISEAEIIDALMKLAVNCPKLNSTPVTEPDAPTYMRLVSVVNIGSPCCNDSPLRLLSSPRFKMMLILDKYQPAKNKTKNRSHF